MRHNLINLPLCTLGRQRNPEAVSAKEAMLRSRHDGFGDEVKKQPKKQNKPQKILDEIMMHTITPSHPCSGNISP